MKKLTQMKSLPQEERPREKAWLQGIASLSDSELLAILLGSGTRTLNVLQLAQLLLQRFQNFRRLAQSTLSELTQVPGIGRVRAIEIKACLEIARRFHQIELRSGKTVRCSQDIFEHFHQLLRDEKREKFFVVLLDSKHRVIRHELISVGSLNLSIVHPREVFHWAIREAAGSIVLVHNHPSGDPAPSSEDIKVTQRLLQVGKMVGIEVLDHIIIGDGGYISLMDENLLR